MMTSETYVHWSTIKTNKGRLAFDELKRCATDNVRKDILKIVDEEQKGKRMVV